MSLARRRKKLLSVAQPVRRIVIRRHGRACVKLDEVGDLSAAESVLHRSSVRGSATALLLGLACALTTPSLGWAQCDYPAYTDPESAAYAEAAQAGLKPLWIGRVGAVYFDRATDDSRALMQNNSNPSEQLNANDLNFDWNSGIDASLMRKYWDDSGVELRYLDLGRFDATAALPISNNIVRINSTPPAFAPNVQAIAARSTSEFFSIEANYHYPLYDCFDFLVGFRYLSLDESITTVLDSSPQTFTLNTSTENDLYGIQIGLYSVPDCPLFGCVWGTGYGKIGIYGNDARHLSILNTGVGNLPVSQSADNASPMGELGLTAMIPLGHYMSVRGGYSMIWLERIAIASDQIARSNFVTGKGRDDRGGTIFHGATLAFQIQL